MRLVYIETNADNARIKGGLPRRIGSNREKSVSQIIKILYVEDDAEDQKIFRHFVRKVDLLRYFLECAKSLSEARALLAIQKYDLIFVDNHLGSPIMGENGVQLIEELASAGEDTPIVLLTGSGLPHDNQLVLDLIRRGKIWFAQKEDLDSEGLENLITTILTSDQAIQRSALSSHEIEPENAA